jgi:hypothetical protein
MVNSRPADIFNGILETQKSAEEAENFAEILQNEAAHPRVYHMRINHKPAMGKLNTLASRDAG